MLSAVEVHLLPKTSYKWHISPKWDVSKMCSQSRRYWHHWVHLHLQRVPKSMVWNTDFREGFIQKQKRCEIIKILYWPLPPVVKFSKVFFFRMNPSLRFHLSSCGSSHISPLWTKTRWDHRVFLGCFNGSCWWNYWWGCCSSIRKCRVVCIWMVPGF